MASWVFCEICFAIHKAEEMVSSHLKRHCLNCADECLDCLEEKEEV